MLKLRRRSRRRVQVALGVSVALVVCLLAAWAGWAYRMLDHPQLDRPTAADAVVVLGPVTENGSIDTGISLVNQGLARTLLVSVVDGQRGPVGRMCRGESSAAVNATLTCFVPDPTTTRGEARAVADLATRNHWHTVIVVTPTFHVARSRMLFQRCFTGQLEMVAPQTPLMKREWVFQAVYQSAAFLKAWLQDGC